MDVAKLLRRDAFSFAFQICYLSGDQLQGSRSIRQLPHEMPMGVPRNLPSLAKNVKSVSQESITRQHGNTFPKHLVIGRFASAEIVIVHAGQIIMNKRIGMDTFHGAGHGQGAFHATPARLRGRQAEDRPQSFAAGEQGVAHSLVDRSRFGGGFGEIPIQGGLNQASALLQVSGNVKDLFIFFRASSGANWHGDFVENAWERGKHGREGNRLFLILELPCRPCLLS